MKRIELILPLVWLAACSSPEVEQPQERANTVTIESGRAKIRLAVDGEPTPELSAAITTWVNDAAQAVTAYYGRMPVDELDLFVELRAGDVVESGVTNVVDGTAVIRMPVGRMTSTKNFRTDWVLTHEMVHTAFPDLPEPHHWLEEGLATYVEPIARARAGLTDDADVWRQLVQGVPQGQPLSDDRGLDRTHTWGRTYWGGALFCLLADVGIRERTGNKLGLRDALVALQAEGLTILRSAPIEHVLARMDAAVGVPVVSELYAQHARTGVRVDLDGLWKRLGVVHRRGRITFDDNAPQAALRRAITH